MEVSGQLHVPDALPQRKSAGTHWIGGWDDDDDSSSSINQLQQNIKQKMNGI
jgi:hypothetical protein